MSDCGKQVEHSSSQAAADGSEAEGLDGFTLDAELIAGLDGYGKGTLAPPKPLSAQERNQLISVWLKVPQTMCSLMTQGDQEGLERFINRYFSQDVVLRTIAMDEGNRPEVCGRRKVLEFLGGLVATFPDSIYGFRSCRVDSVEDNFICIVFSNSFSGTEADPDHASSSLYKAGRNPEFVAKVVSANPQISGTEQEKVLQEKQKQIHSGEALAYSEVSAMGKFFISRDSNPLIVRYESWWTYVKFDALKL